MFMDMKKHSDILHLDVDIHILQSSYERPNFYCLSLVMTFKFAYLKLGGATIVIATSFVCFNSVICVHSIYIYIVCIYI